MSDYDKFADDYERETLELENKTRSNFYSLLPKSLKNQKILDVGCGTGIDAKYYSKHGAKVCGMDISEKEIEIAKKQKLVEFVVGDMIKLPYKPNTFNIVTSVYSLQTSEDVTKSILEMIRIVKPKGTILILTKHPFRNLLESHINDGNSNYYEKRKVTSYIFNKKITLREPGHTLMEYFDKNILKRVTLETIEEHTDFPASEQVIPELVYPTYIIIKFRKNKL
jgi:ubiquinone/menaquinone biosynthesis C-methylase UbiE